MTINEFRAFLEGIAIPEGEAPTPEQWSRIQEKIGALEARPLPSPVTPAPAYIPPSFSPYPADVPYSPNTVTC